MALCQRLKKLDESGDAKGLGAIFGPDQGFNRRPIIEPGQVVELTIERLGTLRNRVVPNPARQNVK